MGESLYAYLFFRRGGISLFYVKQALTDRAEVTVEITDDNVFCRCPLCGREVAVDLQEILAEEDTDLMGTVVLCEECVEEWMKKHGQKP